jgi:diguanylate cyclase (GGDEF)-like protein
MSFVQRQKKSMVINKPASGRGDLHKHKIMAVPILTQSGRVSGMLAFFKPSDDADFARREQYLGRHIARQIGALLDSQYDLATGLFTRVAFEQQVNQFLNGRADRMHSFAYIDVDELHAVNDAFGYDAGDELIVRVADSLRPPALPGDAIAARTAGDRFLLFLPGYDTEEAHECAVNLQKLVAQIGLGSGSRRMTVSFSCGISRLLEVDQPVARAIAAAELACKTAKERGRNRCEVYLDVDASMMRRRVDVAGLEKLRDALEHDRLVLYGHRIAPIGDAPSTAAVECLVGLRNPDGSVVHSAELMATAKRFKLLKEIDEWSIKRALKMLTPHASMMLHSGMRVAINISGESLNDEHLAANIADWVRASKVPPGRITFEIAETTAASNLPLANKLIRGLQHMGCRFTLDAFGTGVNSLSYLKSLQVHSVKIDGSYVRDIATNSRSASMVRAIVDLARNLEIESIADLVESDAVLKKLQEIGVDYVQGSRIHEPQELRSFLDAQTNAATQAMRQIVLMD